MITKQDAMTFKDFHHNERRNKDGTCERWRANGKCRTWKTRPEQFSLPIKYGFYGGFDYLTQDNMTDFHLPESCENGA